MNDSSPNFPRFNLNELLGRVSVTSALTDMIWLTGIFLIIIFLLAVFHADILVIIFAFILLAVILIYFIYSHHYLLKNNPDLLRSERFQLRKYEMEMMGTKDSPIPLETLNKEESVKKLRSLMARKKSHGK